MQQQANRKPMVRRGASADVVNVESQSTRGIFYSVNGRTGQCSCPAGRHNRLCWHLGMAQAFAAMRAAAAASTVPVPALAPFHKTAGYRALAECFG